MQDCTPPSAPYLPFFACGSKKMGAASEITIRMKFFAATRDMTDTSDASLTIPSTYNSDDLVRHLQQLYPKLAKLAEQLPTILAINQAFLPLGETAALKDGDEVALIPPISGG
eukprot:TRINITY_DN35154_c0_g1_i2.p3 TRINITY_DN35154_c0_g1~~TRINITY_DN35154_c0_g1_i2.p3  ORF type:complete len:113 (+),score=31.54 TRINITY_DN35154_c0_g1_i2:250-588(+)